MNDALWNAIRKWWGARKDNNRQREHKEVVIEALLDLHDRLAAIEERLKKLEER